MTVAPVELSHVWEPNPKQADVLRIISEAPDDSISLIFYGGAASGGKTNLDANLALKIALGCPGSRTLVGRQDFIDLKTTTLQEFDRSLPAGMDVKRYDSAPVYRDLRSCAKNVPESEHPYSRIYFRGLEDWQSLLSEEYGWIIIDEGQQVQLAAALGLMSRLRHKPERKRGMVVTFNPFPSWCVEWGMRGKLPKEIKANPNIRVNFIQARVDDNKHVPEGYRELLAANPDPFLRAILLDGNPDAALDSVLYFSREQLEQSRLYCSEPMEIKLTRPEPDAMADGHVLIWDKPMTSERYTLEQTQQTAWENPYRCPVGWAPSSAAQTGTRPQSTASEITCKSPPSTVANKSTILVVYLTSTAVGITTLSWQWNATAAAS